MKILIFLAALSVAIYIIVRFRKKHWEQRVLPYPLLLATFPVYYFVFAIYAEDLNALIYEISVGLLFFAVAYFAYIIRNRAGLVLLGLGCMAHAVYDVAHDSLFSNPGTPVWWPEFCGIIDVILGGYLIYLAVKFNRPFKASEKAF